MFGTHAHYGRLALPFIALALAACSAKPAAKAAPVPVQVASVDRRTVPLMAQYVAQTQAMQQVELVPRVEGTLDHIYFTNGSFVQRGDLLMDIQADQYEAQVLAAQGGLDKANADLARAKANVQDVTAKAKLAQALAAFHYQQVELARMAPLAHAHAVSQKDYDQTKTQFDAAAADVVAARANVEDVETNQRTAILDAQGTVAQATAQLDNARLELGYTKIYSPVTGIISFAEVDEGNLVSPAKTTKLATVSTIDPIKAVFQLSESDYLKIANDLIKLRQSGTRPDVSLVLSNGERYRYTGHAVAINRALDSSTGTIAVESIFPNPAGFLRPGQYGRVTFAIGVAKNALIVPRSSVQSLQNMPIVYIVGDGNKAVLRTVDTGAELGDSIVITRGLAPGDRVVVSPGTRVQAGTLLAPQSSGAK